MSVYDGRPARPKPEPWPEGKVPANDLERLIASAPRFPAPLEQKISKPRDASKPAVEQGLFHKFRVQRVDGSDRIGGKHYGCRYYVLDLTHDEHAPAAMRAYAAACRVTHPQLAADIEIEYPPVTLPLDLAATLHERERFEAHMRAEGVTDFSRRPTGRYENMVLEWHWLGWRGRARAGAPS